MKPQLEYRLICAQTGQRGHTTHTYRCNAKNYEKKRREANEWTEHLRQRYVGTGRDADTDFYSNEAPWRVQTREITEWEDLDA